MKRLLFLTMLILTILSISQVSADSKIILKSNLHYGILDSINQKESDNLTFYFRFNKVDLDINYLSNNESFCQLGESKAYFKVNPNSNPKTSHKVFRINLL